MGKAPISLHIGVYDAKKSVNTPKM